VITGVALIILIIGTAVAGPTAFFFLAAIVVLLAQFELLDALRKAGRRPVLPLALAGGAAMLVVAYYEKPRLLAAVLAATLVGAFVLAMRPGRGPEPMTDVAWTLLSVAWITGGGAAAVMLLRLDDGLSLLISFVLITALDDIGAFFVGTRFGKHKLAPSISPAKSWEGFAGGMVTTLAGGAAFGSVVDALGVENGLALGVIAGFLAPVGDLVESMAKRELGIKDSSGLLPGHGGFFDRLDAIIFCAPAAFLYIRFVADLGS
jgi:phosphatidate cytidylyltransferase